jgi:hypothetical protein
MRVAVDQGAAAGGGASKPWLFRCDDGNDYYTKLFGRCGEQPPFREAELVTSAVGVLLGVPVAKAEVVFVPAVIAVSPGLGVNEQYAVGMLRINGTEEPAATFAALVATQSNERRLAMVALHSLLVIGDHSPGHNFFRDFVSNELVTIDHASALAPFFGGASALPAPLVDNGGLLAGIAPGDPSRKHVADRVRGVQRIQLETIMATFPTDPVHPWLDVGRRADLVQWILDRGGEVADGIEH